MNEGCRTGPEVVFEVLFSVVVPVVDDPHVLPIVIRWVLVCSVGIEAGGVADVGVVGDRHLFSIVEPDVVSDGAVDGRGEGERVCSDCDIDVRSAEIASTQWDDQGVGRGADLPLIVCVGGLEARQVTSSSDQSGLGGAVFWQQERDGSVSDVPNGDGDVALACSSDGIVLILLRQAQRSISLPVLVDQPGTLSLHPSIDHEIGG